MIPNLFIHLLVFHQNKSISFTQNICWAKKHFSPKIASLIVCNVVGNTLITMIIRLYQQDTGKLCRLQYILYLKKNLKQSCNVLFPFVSIGNRWFCCFTLCSISLEIMYLSLRLLLLAYSQHFLNSVLFIHCPSESFLPSNLFHLIIFLTIFYSTFNAIIVIGFFLIFSSVIASLL